MTGNALAFDYNLLWLKMVFLRRNGLSRRLNTTSYTAQSVPGGIHLRFEIAVKSSNEEGDVLVVALNHDSAYIDGVCHSGAVLNRKKF